MLSGADPCPCGSGRIHRECCKFERPRNPKQVPGQDTRELEWNEVHRLAYCVLLLQGGNPVRAWAAYLPSIHMIKEYIPKQHERYGCAAYDADFVRRRLENVTGFPVFLAVFQNPNWQTGDPSFEGAKAVGDDVEALTEMMQSSAVLMGDAYEAGPTVGELSGSHAYLASSPREAYDLPAQDLRYEGIDLTAEDSHPPDRMRANLVADLDSHEIIFRTARIKWRFPTTACSMNTQIVLRRAAELEVAVEPWAGWLIRGGGASAHSWVIRRSEMGSSICDLTLTQPAIFESMHLKMKASAFDLDAEIHKIRQSSPLLQTRIVGKVPGGFVYRGRPVAL